MTIQCPGCKQPWSVADDQAGLPAACPACGMRVRVPAPRAAPPLPPPVPAKAQAEDAPRPRLKTEGDGNPFASLEEEESERPLRLSRSRPRLPQGVRPSTVGEPEREYTMPTALPLLIGGVVAFFIGLILLPIGFSLGAKANPGLPLVLAGAAALILGAGCAVVGLVRLRAVILCSRGFAVRGLFGAQGWSFADVDEIHEKHVTTIVTGDHNYTTHSHVYDLDMKDGTSLRFNENYGNILDLGKRLQAAVTEAKWPAAMAEIDAGKWVEFGPFKLSKWGVFHVDAKIPWNEVEVLDVQNGELLIYRRFARDFWAKEMLADIPNLVLFGKIVARASGSAE